MKVCLDTSGLFAALVRNDKNHGPAGPLLRQLLSGNRRLIITGYVLQELIALLRSRVGLEAARSFEHSMRPLFDVYWVDEDLHNAAFRRMELRSSRRVSLADCSSFLIMERLGIELVFGFDRHFEQEGFRLLQSPDDLESG